MVFFSTGPRATGLLLGALVLLAPTVPPTAQRNGPADIVRLKTANCEYRGITATFAELTQAYALEAYRSPQLLRWQARTSPHNPDGETLVTALFSIDGPRPDSPAYGDAAEARQQAGSTVAVTWRFNDMNGVQITPYDAYARDAVHVFRQTVEGFLAEMHLTRRRTPLRHGAGTEYDAVDTLEAGVVLLEKEQRAGWSRVRSTSTSATGWLPTRDLQALADAD